MSDAVPSSSPPEGEPRLRIVTGKGGVGKSAVATALAIAEARRGKRVLLAEANGRDQITALLGAAPVGFEMREVLENLYVVDINPQDAIREYAMLVVRFESIYKIVFQNRFVRHFLRMIPSLGEMVILGKLWYHEQEQVKGRRRFDVIILDAPATGHAISMLRTPGAVEKAVPPGAMRENARIIRELLTDPRRCCLHLVTLPEEMPVTEARELYEVAKDDLGIRVNEAFINQAMEEVPAEALRPLELKATPQSLFEAAAETLQLREQKRRTGEEHLTQLPPALLENALRLPRLMIKERFDKNHIEALAEIIGSSLPQQESQP